MNRVKLCLKIGQPSETQHNRPHKHSQKTPRKYIRHFHFGGVSNTTPFLVCVRLPRKLVVKISRKIWKIDFNKKKNKNSKTTVGFSAWLGSSVSFGSVNSSRFGVINHRKTYWLHKEQNTNQRAAILFSLNGVHCVWKFEIFFIFVESAFFLY